MVTAENTFPKFGGDVAYASDFNALQIVNVEAGENLTAGNVVYIKKNDGKAYLSDTGTADDIRANGIVIDTVTSGNTADIQIGGNYATSGLTAAEATSKVLYEYADVNNDTTKAPAGRFVWNDSITKTTANQVTIVTVYKMR